MNRLLVKPATRWYEQYADPPDRCSVSDKVVHKLSQECITLMQEEASLYQTCKALLSRHLLGGFHSLADVPQLSPRVLFPCHDNSTPFRDW